jgi:hypothetical protein
MHELSQYASSLVFLLIGWSATHVLRLIRLSLRYHKTHQHGGSITIRLTVTFQARGQSSASPR